MDGLFDFFEDLSLHDVSVIFEWIVVILSNDSDYHTYYPDLDWRRGFSYRLFRLVLNIIIINNVGVI